MVVFLRLRDLELDDVVEKVGLQERGQLALANLNNLLPDIELGIHGLQDQMHGLEEIADTVM